MHQQTSTFVRRGRYWHCLQIRSSMDKGIAIIDLVCYVAVPGICLCLSMGYFIIFAPGRH